ncbi:MAG: DUF4190 domain-containing protein [Verrucomicrobia bacterium]|nr:DUF4190 domain-containing protein [Verrucomicrobiota bacterium]
MNPTESSPAKYSALAIWSFVLGLLGLVLCPLAPLLGLPGVICGHMGLSRIGKSGGALTGKGLAIAGLITGYFSFALFLAFISLFAMAYRGSMHGPRSGRQPTSFRGRLPAPESLDEAGRKKACIANLQQIQGAKDMWAREHKKSGPDLPTDADLFGSDKYLSEKPVCPSGGTYSLNNLTNKPACSIPDHAW